MVALSEQRFWNLSLDHPIEIEHGDQWLETLGDVGTFILALPEALKQQPSWQAATESVLEAAKSGDMALVTIAVHIALMLSGKSARSVWEDGRTTAGSPDPFPGRLHRLAGTPQHGGNVGKREGKEQTNPARVEVGHERRTR